MLLRLSRHVLLWSLLFLLSGGHHYVAQGIAWGGMLITKASQNSLWQAAERTFSGKEPCSICHKASEAREKEHQQESPFNVEIFQAKVSLFAFLSEKLLAPHRECIGRLANKNVVWQFDLEAPATPPPKLIS